jgi:hypothetical protein
VERGHAGEKHRVTLPTVSNYTIHDTEDTENGKQADDGLYPPLVFYLRFPSYSPLKR